MNWSLILKATYFPAKGPLWARVLHVDSNELQQWITKAKEMLKEDSSPADFPTFIRQLRDNDGEDWLQKISSSTTGEYGILADMSWSVKNQILTKMEQNFDTLKEAFKEYIDKPSSLPPAAHASNEKRQQVIETFQQAAKFIEEEREVNWEELESALESYTTPKHRKRLIEDIGDKVNRIIALNVPEEKHPRLKAFYKYYEQVGETIEYEVNDIDSKRALIYITEIQSKAYIPGQRLAAAKGFRWPKNEEGSERKQRQPLAAEFHINALKKLQGKVGQKRPFTIIFKSILKGDLEQQEDIASLLSQTMKNRAVNQKAVLDRIIEIAYSVNQEELTIEEANRTSGLNLKLIEHLIPSIKSEDKTVFETEFKNELFKDGAKGQRDVTRQFEIKISDYRKGVPKIFRDFITDIVARPGTYEDIFNGIWTNSYTQFRQESEYTSFRRKGNMLAKNGKTYPIWGLPVRGKNKEKIIKMYKFIIRNDRSVDDNFSSVAQGAFRKLRGLFRTFKKANIEDSEEELFGDLLNVTVADEPDIVQKFSDPFRKALAYLFLDVKDGNTKLEELTAKYDIVLRKDINIINVIRELKETEKVVTGRARLTHLLSDTGKYQNSLSQNISNEEIVILVNEFINDLNSVVTNIREGVKKLITDKLTRMINSQALYLPFNNVIFIILEGFDLISEV